MNLFQERKYDAIDGKIVNRATGQAIPDDEPIIIFRAKDRKTVAMLIAYQTMCENETHKEVIQGRIDDFLKWQNENIDKVKEPDSDSSCLR